MNEDNGEPLLLWSYRDGWVDEAVEIWGRDTDGDYRLVIRGRHTVWIPQADIRELIFALLRDHLNLKTVTPEGQD